MENIRVEMRSWGPKELPERQKCSKTHIWTRLEQKVCFIYWLQELNVNISLTGRKFGSTRTLPIDGCLNKLNSWEREALFWLWLRSTCKLHLFGVGRTLGVHNSRRSCGWSQTHVLWLANSKSPAPLVCASSLHKLHSHRTSKGVSASRAAGIVQ